MFFWVLLVGWVHAADAPYIRFARFRGDARAAVSLTFDDALPSHLNKAVPILNRYGLHATFFIFTDNVKTDATWERWGEVARAGHELGSHSKSHPPLSELNNPRRIRIEINGSAETIKAKTGVRPISFAYPFSDVDDIIRRRVRDAYFVDRDSCRIWGGAGFKAAAAITNIEQAVDRGEWFFCMMHGIDDKSFKAMPSAELEKIARYLADKRPDIWTASYGQVALYKTASRLAELKFRDVRDDGFSLRLKIPAGTPYKEYMKQPLTLKISCIGHDGERIKAYCGDDYLVSAAARDNRYILLDVIPDGRWVDVYWLK
jgi:peptidoglycan/xylan/chitin deacetylase (PgdA/CDA1 family)